MLLGLAIAQLLVSFVLQTSAVELPTCTRAGVASKLTIFGSHTLTVTYFVLDPPPELVQVSLNVDVCCGRTVVLPEIAPPVEKPVPLHELVVFEE